MLNSATWLDNEHSEKEKKGGKGEFDILHNIKTLCEGCNIGDVEYCPLARQ